MPLDRNSVIKEAQKLASKGQFDKAVAEWRKLVKEDPNDATAFNTIGDLCLKKNAKADAVEAYKRAADILAEDGFTSKAIALYKKVLNIDMNRVDVHLALGDMNAEKGLTGNALENYKFVADFYKKQNNTAKALGIYQKMADLNPTNIAFREKLAGMYAKEKMVPEAVKAYLDAADVHVEKNEFQEARQMFEKVLELDAGNKAVYHKAGIVYFKEGKLDEARKALRSAFEANPENEELMQLYLEVLEKAGRAGDAEEVYRKLLAADPSRHDLHEKLYDMYVGKQDYDKALEEAVAIADLKAEGMDFGAAAEVLKKLLAMTHDPPAVASALAAFFEKHGRAQDGARELVQVSEALIERGSRDDAREVLNRALLLSPGHEEAIARLSSLAAAHAPAAGAPQPDLGMPEQPEEIEELTPPTFEVPLPPEAPVRAAPSVPLEEAEDPVVTSALNEADVLIKYGLIPKAIEQLEMLLQKRPDQLEVRARLLGLYRGQKQNDKAVLQALMLAEEYEQRGRSEESRSVLRAALDLAPDNAQIRAKLGMPPAEPEAPEVIETIEEPETLEPIASEEVPELAVPSLDLDVSPALEDELQVPEMSEVAEELALPEVEEEAPAVEEVAGFEEPAGGPVEEEVSGESDVMELWAEAEFYFQQGLFDEARKRYEQYLDLQPGDKKAMERIVEITRDRDEVEEFSRLAESVEGLESLVGTSSESGETVTEADVNSVRSLMQEISELRKEGRPDRAAKEEEEETSFADVEKELSPARPSREDETSFADVDRDLAEERSLSEEETSFAGVEEEPEAAAPSATEDETSFADIAGELKKGEGKKQAAKEEESDASADFFDLAAELRDELSTTVKAEVPSHEQSLDEIFDEFKKGVEAHEKKEDEDTHYNLGIAYREMGLLDDAISEFTMTTEGETKFIQSRYLLGLCYLEKGDFETAITEIQNALGYSYSFGEAGDERLGMHYDLGLAYQGTGNNQGALEEFQKVNSLDPSYREVASKIQELQEGDFISLDSIKEDIEKEISFKFLEEGARIEREEKTKKTKK
jgi:pilus assembly protein FimV